MSVYACTCVFVTCYRDITLPVFLSKNCPIFLYDLVRASSKLLLVETLVVVCGFEQKLRKFV